MKKKLFQFDFKTRHAGIAVLITIVVLAAVILVNVLLGETTIQADLTPKKLFSLTDETKAFLDELSVDVEILALYGPGEESEGVMETVNEYERLSNRVRVRIVDPDRNPALVSGFAENGQEIAKGSFIVSSGRYSRIISAIDLYEISYSQQGQPQVIGQKVEQQITSAIAYVSSGRTPKIYEITGHRESPLGSLGYADMLGQSNYVLEELSLVRSDIPADTDLLTLIGPKSDLSKAEAEKIHRYLEDGGRLFIALDYSPEPFKNIDDLLGRWDIAVRHGLVMEQNQNRLVAEFGDNPFVFAPFLTDDESVASLGDAKLDPVFQITMGFQRTPAEQRQLEYFPFLQSSSQSWLRSELDSPESSQVGGIAGDEPGPIDVAIGIRQRNLDTYKPEGAAIVAFGTASTLGGLGYLGQIEANAELVLNLVNWVVNDESAVNVGSKSLFRLPLRIGNLVAISYAGITIILIPLTCIIAGLVIWLRRRNK